MTANLFLERTFDDPLTAEDVIEGSRESQWCFDTHRVQWHGSFLSRDGRTMICKFSAPDMEAARQALRDPDMDLKRLWSGTVHLGASTAAPNVAVERSFSEPVGYEDIKALLSAKAWCLDTYNVKYAHSFFSADRQRMLCFYSAPDAEAVRSVQREAGAPAAAIWTGSLIRSSAK